MWAVSSQYHVSSQWQASSTWWGAGGGIAVGEGLKVGFLVGAPIPPVEESLDSVAHSERRFVC